MPEPEAVTQRVLLARLNALRMPDGNLVCWCWRNNTGMAQFGSRTVAFGVTGQADISGLIRGGKRLEVEVKTASGRQSPKQRVFQHQIEALGGLYLVCHGVEEIRATLDKVLAEVQR